MFRRRSRCAPDLRTSGSVEKRAEQEYRSGSAHQEAICQFHQSAKLKSVTNKSLTIHPKYLNPLKEF